MRRAKLFGAELRRLRRSADLTLEGLGNRVRVRGKPLSKGYLSGIENAKVSPPSDPVVRKLAGALNAPVKHLLLLAYLDKLPPELLSTGVLRALRDEHPPDQP